MNKKALAAALATMLVAGSAQATQVAGWNFNTYFSAGGLFLPPGGATANTLDAQFSDFDPTFGAGAESAAFGTLYFDGTNGSTFVDPNGFPATFAPTTSDLVSNATAPINGTPVPEVDFNNAAAVIQSELGFSNPTSMTNSSVLSVVFSADLSSLAFEGTGWSISFAGKTFAGSVGVTVEYSTNGSAYTAAGGTQTLTTTDSPFSIALGAPSSSALFVRLNLLGTGAILDNVSIDATTGPAVPEPGAALMAISGLAGLGLLGRRKRA